MNKRIPILLVAMILAQSCLMSRAQSVPEQMNYQGVIANSSGVPLPDGDYDLTFRIFDVATAGVPVWGPQTIATTVVDGQFNVALGPLDQATPTVRELSAGFASANSYLEIQVDANPPIAPRQKILSAPFAFEAAHAASASAASALVTSTGTPLVTSSGNNLTIDGPVAATSFSGSGSGLTGLTAGQIPPLDANKIANGVLSTEQIPSLDASKITSGELDQMLLPDLQSGEKIFSGNVSVTDNLGVGTTSALQKLDVRGNVHASGNVGIGTTSPGEKLTIAGVDNYNSGLKLTGNRTYVGMAIENTAANGKKYDLFVENNGTFWIYDETAGNDRLVINSAGNVGIGTTSPTQGKLVVNGTGADLSLNSLYLNKEEPLLYGSYSQFGGDFNADIPIGDFRVTPRSSGLSIYASGDVAAKGFAAFSDARIKRVSGRSDAARDLSTLQDIEVTDYTYIDAVAKGSGQQKKVIAQQIEKVFPQAVQTSTDVVPDIYQKAGLKEGWVNLATDLKKGERVRLIGENEEGVHEVLEIAEGRFRTDFKPEGDEIFVYGREVNDFRNVDYQAIAMLNVSATQELARQLEEKTARVTKLEEEVAALKKMMVRLAQVSNESGQPARVLPTTQTATGTEILPVNFTSAK